MVAAAATEKEKPLTVGEIIERERESHHNFFGCEFDLGRFAETLKRYDENRLILWRNLGLEPHYLPLVSMVSVTDFSGWRIKPGKWLCDQVAREMIRRRHCEGGSIKPDKDVFRLEGITVLIDIRLKPQWSEGRQMFENDCLLGPVIERLVKDGKLRRQQRIPVSSRFGISTFDWEHYIKLAFALTLGFAVSQIRLERIIEVNVIPQLYPHLPRRDDGRTNTFVWCEEYGSCVSERIFGGSSECGGLSYFFNSPNWEMWDYRAFRPLIILG